MSDQDYMRAPRTPQQATGSMGAEVPGARPGMGPAAAPQRAPHVSQAPINDVEPTYGMPQRYATLEQQGGSGPRPGRKHMGTATSDPQYLPLTEDEARRQRAWEQQQRQAQNGAAGPGGAPRPSGMPGPQAGGRPAPGQRGPQQLHGARYLQTPTSGKAIFTTRRDRQRHTAQAFLIILVLLAVILALVWFFVLR